MYLIRRTGKKQKAHIWTGEDTACRMYSTGGLKKDGFDLFQTKMGCELCHMCSNVQKEQEAIKKTLVQL